MTPRNMARLGGLALITALMTGVAAPAFAGSFYLQEQSVRGAGRAFSGEAADRGVGSMWWNPASIARSGREVSVGMHAIRIDSEVKNAGSYLTYPGGVDVPVVNPRNTEVDPIESGLVPNFAFATPITSPRLQGQCYRWDETSGARRHRPGTPGQSSASITTGRYFRTCSWSLRCSSAERSEYGVSICSSQRRTRSAGASARA